MATEIEPSMPMAEMTDDMQMVTTWGVLRDYRDEIERLQAVLDVALAAIENVGVRHDALAVENKHLRGRQIVYSPDAKAMSDRCELLIKENEKLHQLAARERAECADLRKRLDAALKQD